MTNFDDHDDKFIVTDFIDDPVHSLSDPISFLCREFYAALSAWIITQCLDPPQNACNILVGDAS